MGHYHFPFSYSSSFLSREAPDMLAERLRSLTIRSGLTEYELDQIDNRSFRVHPAQQIGLAYNSFAPVLVCNLIETDAQCCEVQMHFSLRKSACIAIALYFLVLMLFCIGMFLTKCASYSFLILLGLACFAAASVFIGFTVSRRGLQKNVLSTLLHQ